MQTIVTYLVWSTIPILLLSSYGYTKISSCLQRFVSHHAPIGSRRLLYWYRIYPTNHILYSNLAKSGLLITCFLVTKPSGNFAQSMAVILSCSTEISRRLGNLKRWYERMRFREIWVSYIFRGASHITTTPTDYANKGIWLELSSICPAEVAPMKYSFTTGFASCPNAFQFKSTICGFS